jgi:predicted glycoside hydrolase/deacetylase ChbG (UPF0249 family)
MGSDGRILIVNADDFGHSEGVNAGVIKAHEEGIVTSASLMVRWPAAAAAAAYAREREGFSLGLHVDLGEWAWRGEDFYDQREDDWAPVYEVVPIGDYESVRAEVYAQLRAFRAMVRANPTHLDSHQHVHTSRPAAFVLTQLAKGLDVPLRHHTPEIRYCGDLYGQTSTGEPMWEAISPDNLVAIIRRLGPGITELACHPGQGPDIDSSYGREREAELEALCDRAVRETVEEEGIELRSFADALKPR